ncbi:hypothetical protein IT072_03470 [Leifsonia sp. ZF2019]|uniref:hypothetical protein n=1 Tax=Leifsonia sp. ZF2019 TaxID=2781978 RepID=UPI001CBDE03B|nr:hypothetical protein [Leifsonia sp. ZF2019]UAJ80123.1 hypothetical protein IT072_03470 [Leifsonia sp. ZF2019]
MSEPENERPERGGKKIVRKVSASPKHPSSAPTAEAGARPEWAPTAESKRQATLLRLIAMGSWVIAVGGELFAVLWVLRQQPVSVGLLVAVIVLIGAFAVTGSLLWKRANRLNPAAKADRVRFFVQNQLGAIIAVVAFLPLIIVVLSSKNLDPRQKAVAGSVGILAAAIAVFAGIDFNPPSVEEYSQETNIVQQLTGQDVVYWTKSGTVFHVCSDVPDVNKESRDHTIYEGTVADAHAAGKQRLTQKWKSEAVAYCGYTQEQVSGISGAVETQTPEPTRGSGGQ